MRFRDRLVNPVNGGLSATGRLYLRTAAIAAIGLAILALGILVAGFDDMRQLLAGALLAWGGGIVAWAVLRARQTDEDIRRQIRHHAEYDVIHIRLNEIAQRVGASETDMAGGLEELVNHREQMIAHWTGLEEYRGP